MKHRIARLVFALGVGSAVAFMAWQWISNPAPRVERELEESIVDFARQQLRETLELDTLMIVDPLAQNRVLGKSYIYRAGDGWEVSGYYRRAEGDRWHPFLMTLNATPAMTHLKVQDASLGEQAAANALIEVLP